MVDRSYDAVVLGGGPAGYVCAIRLGQLGQRVACVEAESVGGVCLNWGCIPSKALISAAHLHHQVAGAAAIGLHVEGVRLDVAELQAWKQGLVGKLTAGVRTLLRANGVEVVSGRGRLADARTVECVDAQGGVHRLAATKGIVVATGSATIELPGFAFDGRRIWGARDAVDAKTIPKRLVVIGGGVIGLELGMVYQELGSQLSVVEMTDGLLPGIDAECVAVVARAIERRGGQVLTSARATGYRVDADGDVAVDVATSAGPRELRCDVVLVAVGMRPRSRDLGLEALGVQIDARGFVVTDATTRSSVEGIYAIGDVSGPPMLAHKASKEGEVCAEVIAGKATGKDWTVIPSIVFTQPEVASVGLTAAQAAERGMRVKEGRFPFAALGRAMSLRETDGFVKVVRELEGDRIVGVHIVGPSASDLISEAALAIEVTATAEDVALTIHPHPTLGEALMEASAASLGRAIHIVNR